MWDFNTPPSHVAPNAYGEIDIRELSTSIEIINENITKTGAKRGCDTMLVVMGNIKMPPIPIGNRWRRT